MPDPDHTEFIPDQLTLIGRLDTLTDRINVLRNHTQGQGVQPISSLALAERVNRAQEDWHALRARLLAGNGAEMKAHPYDVSQSFENWERAYNDLVSAAIAERVPGVDATALIGVTHTVQTLGEATGKAEAVIGDALSTFFKGLVFVAAVAGAAYVWANRRPQRGRAA
jgi:hypothetical protein